MLMLLSYQIQVVGWSEFTLGYFFGFGFDQEYFRMLLQSAYKRFIDNDNFLSKYYHVFDDENFEYTLNRNGKEYKMKGSYFE